VGEFALGLEAGQSAGLYSKTQRRSRASTPEEINVEKEFSTLERNILKAKGLSDEQLGALNGLGIVGRADFQTVGDLSTLLELMPDLDLAVAVRILEWAVPTASPLPATPAGTGQEMAAPPRTGDGVLVVNSSDSVYCLHCQFKQPKDYTPGDLCLNCGLQAEPIETCYWCGSTGPGRFCRVCGAAFVGTAELSLAVMLRRDGVAKDDIPPRLKLMGQSEKDALWGRVRRARM